MDRDRIRNKTIVATGATVVSLMVFDMGVAGTIVTFVSTFLFA